MDVQIRLDIWRCNKSHNVSFGDISSQREEIITERYIASQPHNTLGDVLRGTRTTPGRLAAAVYAIFSLQRAGLVNSLHCFEVISIRRAAV